MGAKVLQRLVFISNPFREELLNLFRTRGELLIISTGFMIKDFNENRIGDLIEAILNGFNGIEGSEVMIIGGYWSDEMDEKYNAYISAVCQLKNILNEHGIRVSFWKCKTGRWHSKIYIKVLNDEVIYCIMGSSNFTATTIFKSNRNIKNGFFNIETDISFFDLEYVKNDSNSSLIVSCNEIRDCIKRCKQKINRLSDDFHRLTLENHKIGFGDLENREEEVGWLYCAESVAEKYNTFEFNNEINEIENSRAAYEEEVYFLELLLNSNSVGDQIEIIDTFEIDMNNIYSKIVMNKVYLNILEARDNNCDEHKFL